MCKIANLRQDPFASHSAENELEILDDIFYTPPFYESLKTMLKSGRSRFILGQRGHGKSMLIHQLKGSLYREGCLPVVIDKYDDIPLKDNEQHFLYRIIQSITMGIAEKIVDKTLDLDGVDNTLKQKFGVLVEMFYDEKWAPSFMEKMSVVQDKKRWNKFKTLFNRFFRRPLDEIGHIGIAITGELLRQTIVGNHMVENSSENRRSLFPGFAISEFKTVSIRQAHTIPLADYKSILNLLIELVKQTRLQTIVVLFDRVDEFAKLNSDSKKVAKFTSGLLLDTDLLYKVGIVFSLWSGSKNELNNVGVRFDKFPYMDIRWENKDLEGIIDKRLTYYSIDKKNPVRFSELIPQYDLRQKVFELSEQSPRYMLILLNEIQAQETGTHIRSFTNEAIGKGMMKFCKQFDFQAERAIKSGAGQDMKYWVNKLLFMRKPTFTAEEYATLFVANKKTANDHLKKMQAMWLIRISPLASGNGDLLYEITDPRIVHLMSRNVDSID